MNMTHPTLDDKLYDLGNGRKLSMRDLLDYFAQMGRLRVSDLHIKAGVPPVYRVDGQLQKMKGPPLTRESVELLARSLLTEHEWPRLVEGRSTDGSCMTDTMQFRLNFFHENEGLAIAIRALESSAPAVEEIGFPNNVWRDIVARQHGLVLVTGITGAGKSTTIASLIDRIAQTRPCRIITLEDPIEYRLHSKAAIISQREVGRDVPSFERGLRDCLREDPDVIFVGEMRDRESAAWTLTAAETGHLVFSTLHTRDTRGTLTRVLDMFPPNKQDEIASQLSLGLSHVISQKLIPRAKGEGRIVAMEIMNNIYACSNLIRQCKVEQIYSQLQTRTKDVPEERMTTLERSLANLVRAGHITPLEAEKWANNPSAFLEEMQRV
ncbi:MAG: twitching motility protein PilT [Phycisphaerae bacterium]|nr:MAG: twitching motility protein [Planctomycetota bacterium]GJQ27372.1 MAG: twitching motility protein PilT [Phycisphaerae bacterium]